MVHGLVGVRRPGNFLDDVVDHNHDNVQDSKHTDADQNTETNQFNKLFSFDKVAARLLTQEFLGQKLVKNKWTFLESFETTEVNDGSKKAKKHRQICENGRQHRERRGLLFLRGLNLFLVLLHFLCARRRNQL